MSHPNKILVIGGAGFIGSNLVHRLIQEGHDVRIFARNSLSLMRISDLVEQCDVVIGNFLDDVTLRKAMEGVRTVYHLVTTTFPADTQDSCAYDITSNLLPTIRLLEACSAQGVEDLMYASSGGTVYGEAQSLPIKEDHPRDPTSLYGFSKLTIENFLLFYRRVSPMRIHLLRLSNAYGPHQNPYGVQGIVGVALNSLSKNIPLKVFGDGETLRDYIYIDDIVEALVMMMQRKESSVFNVSSGEGHTVNQVLAEIESLVGKKLQRQHCPIRSGDVLKNVLDNSLIRETCGWSPQYSLKEGIARTWEWFEQRGNSGF